RRDGARRACCNDPPPIRRRRGGWRTSRANEAEVALALETAGGAWPLADGHGGIDEGDVYYFREGTHARLYRVLGAHPVVVDDTPGVRFAVWAPNAEHVAVIGDFNGWDKEAHPMSVRGDWSGIWHAFVPGVQPGAAYKYHIRSRYDG